MEATHEIHFGCRDSTNPSFQGLNTEDYRRVMKVVEQAILSTDLALYFRKKDRFLETANCGEIDWQETEKKQRKSMILCTLFQKCTLSRKCTLFRK